MFLNNAIKLGSFTLRATMNVAKASAPVISKAAYKLSESATKEYDQARDEWDVQAEKVNDKYDETVAAIKDSHLSFANKMLELKKQRKAIEESKTEE